MAVFFVEFLFGGLDKAVEQLLFHKVDGTAAEAATHDAGTGDATFFGYVIEKVEFLTTNGIVFRQTLMSFVHFLTNGFVIATVEGIADSKNTVFFFDDKLCPEIILCGYIC